MHSKVILLSCDTQAYLYIC